MAQAGRKGAVTIATNMAGRGTDIILGGNPETLAWAKLKQLKDTDGRPLYPTRLEVPNDVWYKTVEDSSAKQHAMDCVPYGRYRAMAVSPLTAGRLNPPDICLIYGTPGQMIFFINGLQWTGYKKLSFTSVGESACADSWGKALKTGEPALTIPCYAERRYGGVADDELLMAIAPRYLPQVLEGLAALSKNGLRYPVPPYGIQADAAAGLAVSYADKDRKGA